MLKTRIIPTLLWKDIGLVKGISFDSWRRVGSLLPAIRVYNTRQVDELILVDINATRDVRSPDFATINEISCECFVPFTVGGGIKTIEDIKALLRAGADKVSINSASYDNPKLISEGARLFGNQCIVASIDAKKNSAGKYECYSHSGTKRQNKDLKKWAKELEELGAGEILVTSVERDGTMKGYDVNLIRMITESVSIPVIASGGAGSYKDMLEAIEKGGASAIAAASIFHFTELTPLGAKEYLNKNGIHVRLDKKIEETKHKTKDFDFLNI